MDGYYNYISKPEMEGCEIIAPNGDVIAVTSDEAGEFAYAHLIVDALNYFMQSQNENERAA